MDELITLDEASRLAQPPISQWRTPLLVVVGSLLVILLTVLAMYFLSLAGIKTGLETYLPALAGR